MLETRVEFGATAINAMDEPMETYKKLPDEDSGNNESSRSNHVSSMSIIN